MSRKWPYVCLIFHLVVEIIFLYIQRPLNEQNPKSWGRKQKYCKLSNPRFPGPWILALVAGSEQMPTLGQHFRFIQGCLLDNVESQSAMSQPTKIDDSGDKGMWQDQEISSSPANLLTSLAEKMKSPVKSNAIWTIMIVNKLLSKSANDVAGGSMMGGECKPLARKKKCLFQWGQIHAAPIMKGLQCHQPATRWQASPLQIRCPSEGSETLLLTVGHLAVVGRLKQRLLIVAQNALSFFP